MEHGAVEVAVLCVVCLRVFGTFTCVVLAICLNVATRYTNLFRHPSGTGWWARCVWHRDCSEIQGGLLVSGVVVVPLRGVGRGTLDFLQEVHSSGVVGRCFDHNVCAGGASIQPFCLKLPSREWWSMCAAHSSHPSSTPSSCFPRFVSCDTCGCGFRCVVRVGV